MKASSTFIAPERQEQIATLFQEEGPMEMGKSLQDFLDGWVASPLTEDESTPTYRLDMMSSYHAIQKLLLLLEKDWSKYRNPQPNA